MKRFAAFAAGFTAVVAALVIGLAVVRSGPDPDEVPTEAQVASRVMSPSCPTLTLEECPTAKAAELRGQIAEKVNAGWTNRRIDRWIQDNYGSVALGDSRQRGLAAVAFLPLLGVVAAIGFVTRRRPSAVAEATKTDADDGRGYRAALERELDELRSEDE